MSIQGQEAARFIGETATIKLIRTDIECAARSNAKVLITGERGVGKDAVAGLVHGLSSRAARPLLTINCAGIPDALLESELFGRVRGSFTGGVVRDKVGLLEAADNGTVFLDEVGELTPHMQAILLRFLEAGEIQRVGADRPHVRVNVRLITATSRDLHADVASGAFSEDLYYRLNVIWLPLPPLRERRDDVALLVRHFGDFYSRLHGVPRPQLSEHAMQVLIRHPWAGNVRELKHVMERLAVRNLGRVIEAADLPDDFLKQAAAVRAIGADPDAGAARHAAGGL
jgi:transcriptional regulator with GAF, ATPase, and Fis domain